MRLVLPVVFFVYALFLFSLLFFCCFFPRRVAIRSNQPTNHPTLHSNHTHTHNTRRWWSAAAGCSWGCAPA